MSISQSYLDHLKESLSSMGDVRTRRMFGGAGLFLDGLMFGLIADDVLYFKVDDASRLSFEAENCKPFSYERKDKPAISMSYSQAPDRLFDDIDELLSWAGMAHQVALRNAKPKKPAKKRARKSTTVKT